jgi:hypothetical protein
MCVFATMCNVRIMKLYGISIPDPSHCFVYTIAGWTRSDLKAVLGARLYYLIVGCI